MDDYFCDLHFLCSNIIRDLFTLKHAHVSPFFSTIAQTLTTLTSSLISSLIAQLVKNLPAMQET